MTAGRCCVAREGVSVRFAEYAKLGFRPQSFSNRCGSIRCSLSPPSDGVELILKQELSRPPSGGVVGTLRPVFGEAKIFGETQRRAAMGREHSPTPVS